GSDQPLLSRLSRESALDFTILQASVGHLKAIPYGRFTVRLEGSARERLPAMLQLAQSIGIRHEILR
ncbi:NIL domain-containing protein, partial [Vibrio parahaemolyticus]